MNHFCTFHFFEYTLNILLLINGLQQMPSNVEIKARVSDADNLLRNVLKFTDTPDGTELLQEDTFFDVTRGRLKLRQFKVDIYILQLF